jgi:hypothetical protein
VCIKHFVMFYLGEVVVCSSYTDVFLWGSYLPLTWSSGNAEFSCSTAMENSCRYSPTRWVPVFSCSTRGEQVLVPEAVLQFLKGSLIRRSFRDSV